MGGVLARLAEPTPLTLALGTSLMTALTWAPLRQLGIVRGPKTVLAGVSVVLNNVLT